MDAQIDLKAASAWRLLRSHSWNREQWDRYDEWCRQQISAEPRYLQSPSPASVIPEPEPPVDARWEPLRPLRRSLERHADVDRSGQEWT